MSPAVLIVGFAVGLVSGRVRTLGLTALALGLVWAGLIAISAADSIADLAPAFVVGVANATVGIAVGAAIRLVAVGMSRLRPTA